MLINTIRGNIAEQKVDALIVNLLEGVTVPGGATGFLDAALDGAIREVIAAGDITGKLGETAVLYTRGRLPAPRVIILGLGPLEKLDLNRIRQASASAALCARKLGVRRIAGVVHGAGSRGIQPQAAAQAVVEGALLGLYDFRELKSKPAEKVLSELLLVEFDAANSNQVLAGVYAGQVIAESANFARDLVNLPPNQCTPEYMALQAHNLAADLGLVCSVLDVAQMEAAGMGALLGVASASADNHPPRFIILEHRPAGSDSRPPVVLVGKGITFDSGGLSIKTADGMLTMKSDMAGGAAVLGALRAAAGLKLPFPVVGLVPATENLIGQRGFRPSDVLRASNGKTIEINSTDAEGRLILADALVYAGRYQPRAVVDLATLTGACAIALGRGMAAGLFGTDDDLIARLRRAGDVTGERVWPLPLYEEYSEGIQGEVADLRNSANDRFGGVGWSAAFLREFAEGYPWAHLDIAPVAFAEKARKPWGQGATGFGVRLLAELLQHLDD